MTRAARLAVVEDLRELLRQHGNGGTLLDTEGGPSRPSGGASRGRVHGEGEDRLELPVWVPRGALGVVSGGWSSGKTTLALTRVARATEAGERAAVIDGAGRLYPPALAALGGELERVLLLRPPPGRAVWAGEQLLRSGLFAVVALVGAPRIDRSSLRRLQLAAERGWSTGILVPEDPDAVAPGLTAARFLVQASPPRIEGEGASIAAPPRRWRVERAHLARGARRRGRRAVS